MFFDTKFFVLTLILCSEVCGKKSLCRKLKDYGHFGSQSQSESGSHGKLREVFSWKQIGYDFDGVRYEKSSDYELNPANIHYPQQLNDSERFFIQYNNVPIGMEVFGARVFVTVPRRRHGIPSTLNYVYLDDTSSSPLLKPYPDTTQVKDLVSVYRPRVDECGRLWMVDTGLLEVPDGRKQLQPPAIVVFDLKTDQKILRYELKDAALVNERTPGGLTSITVDVNPSNCADAYAYITDLATGGLIVYSMASNDSWRIEHETFKYEESALNFTSAGHIINWRDGLFSIALSEPKPDGSRIAYYHALASTKEYFVDTSFLKYNRNIDGGYKILGNRETQAGSHGYDPKSQNLFFANVAQDAISCLNLSNKINGSTTIVAQDPQKLVYISDLKVVGDDVWVLANQIPRFVYSTLNPSEFNYFIHRASIPELIKGTVCEV